MYVVIVLFLVREIEIRSGKSQGNLVLKTRTNPVVITTLVRFVYTRTSRHCEFRLELLNAY